MVIGHHSRPLCLKSRSSEARQIGEDTCGNTGVMGLAGVQVLVKRLIGVNEAKWEGNYMIL